MGSPFSITIDTGKLSRGLRPSKRMPRNSGYLVECSGAVGRDGVLQALEELTRLDTSVITDAFPFPQIFVFTQMVIVCSSTKIYEYDAAGALVEKLTVTGGSTWSAVDYSDFLYMSNGSVAVIRSAQTQEYSIVTNQPTAMAICDFNGQAIIGAPDESGLGANMVVLADPVEVTVAQHGAYS